MEETTMPAQKKGVSRREVIVGGAVGAAAFWSVPVIDSVTSRAAAFSGVGLTCGLVFVFYQHSNKDVDIVAFESGPASSVPCFGSSAPVANPCPAPPPMTCFGNSFTLGTDPGGSTFPAATASGSGPHGAFFGSGSGSVGPANGNGACQGQWVITGNVISATGGTNPSDVILVAYAIPNPNNCASPAPSWVCPNTLAVRNSVDLSGICGTTIFH